MTEVCAGVLLPWFVVYVASISAPPLSSDRFSRIHTTQWPRDVSERRYMVREDVQRAAQREGM